MTALHYDPGHSTDLQYFGLPIYSTEGVHLEVFNYIQEMNLPKDSRILVFGCGSGAFEARLFDNEYVDVTGADIMSQNYQIKKLPEYKKKAKFIKVDFEKNIELQIGDKEYDLIVMIDVIEHVRNMTKVIKSLELVTAMGGKLVIATPNIMSEQSIANAALFSGPIAFEGVPYLYEHYSIPSAGILWAIGRETKYYVDDCTSIVNGSFNVPEAMGIKILRFVTVGLNKILWRISNMFPKIVETEISEFFSIRQQEELRKGLYLLFVYAK